MKWGSTGSGPGQFNHPQDLAIDGDGNIYVTDSQNHRIQKFASDGTFLGEWGSPGSADGQFNLPIGIGVDGSGDIFVVDTLNYRVQKFTAAGVFLAKWGSFGSATGQFNNPLGLAIDASGDVYVSDQRNHRIQKFTNAGVFLTQWGSFGTGDGQFNLTKDVRVDANGDLFVVDGSNFRVQKFSSTGTFLGKWGSSGTGDGQFLFPVTAAPDPNGDVYVSDRSRVFPRVQKFSGAGIFIGKWGGAGSEDGQFSAASGIAVDASGNVFVVDTAEVFNETDPNNNRIQKFGPLVCAPPVPVASQGALAALVLALLAVAMSAIAIGSRRRGALGTTTAPMSAESRIGVRALRSVVLGLIALPRLGAAHVEPATPVFEVVGRLEGGTRTGAGGFEVPAAVLTLGGDGNVYVTVWGDYPHLEARLLRIDGGGRIRTVKTFVGEAYGAGLPTYPTRLVVGEDGALYGTTNGPRAGYLEPGGDFYRIDADGSYTPLFSFPRNVDSQLVRGSDGLFYGTLTGTDCQFGSCQPPLIFKIDSSGSFTAVAAGFAQRPSIVGSDGAMYAADDDGFPIMPSLRIDSAGNVAIWGDAPGPLSTLGSDGLLYGVARGYPGHVTRFDRDGHAMVLHAFDGTDGAEPEGITEGPDGGMYGVTRSGGTGRGGTTFRIDSTGEFRTLRSFDYAGGDGGHQPIGSLLLARDHALYGVTRHGSPAAELFRVEVPETVTSWPVIPIGTHPTSALVQARDCALYGLALSWDAVAWVYDTVVYRVFEPGTLCQFIDFPPLPDRTLGDEPLPVTAASSSGLRVYFTASGSCGFGGDEVTLTGVGLCTLTASQPGDARFGPADAISQSFLVLFDVTGFLRPVMNPPVVNRMKAGRTVPIRFSLGGDQERDVVAKGSPRVRRVQCDGDAPVNDITKSSSWDESPRHSARRDRYLIPWKTDPSWAGTCQELSLELIDGSTHRAIFRFDRSHPTHRGPGKH